MKASVFDTGRRLLRRRSAARPVVSILMVVQRGDGDEAIDRAIGSVLSQDFADLELLVVDDASDEDRQRRLRDWAASDDRVSVIRYPRPCGLPGLRLNGALAVAEGEFVGHQVAGCAFVQGGLRALVEAAAGDGEPALVMAAGGEVRNGRPAVLHSRSLISAVGGFDPHIALQDGFEADLWERMSQRVDVRVLAEAMFDPAPDKDGAAGKRVPEGLRLARARLGREGMLAPHALGEVDLLDAGFLPNRDLRRQFREELAAPFLGARCSLHEVGASASNRSLLPDEPFDFRFSHERATASWEITFGNFAALYPDLVKLSFISAAARAAPPEGRTIHVLFRSVTDQHRQERAEGRRRGLASVYCMDDDLLNAHMIRPRMAAGGERASALEAHLRDADLVVVYARALADIVAGLNPRTAVLSTNIRSAMIEPVPRPAAPRPVRYAFIGNALRANELMRCASEMCAFFEAHAGEVALTLFANEHQAAEFAELLPDVPFEVEGKSNYQTYLRRLRRRAFDYVLNPLSDFEFVYPSKSPIKYLEAQVAGAVLITSDVPAYAAVPDGEAAIKAPWVEGAWRKVLEDSLAAAGAPREAMLRRARDHIGRAFTTEAQAFDFVATYLAADLHAALGSRWRERTAVVVENDPAAVQALERFHFSVIDAAGLPAAREPLGAALERLGVALVHAASPDSPLVAAAREAGVPCVAAFDGARPPLPFTSRPWGAEPDLLLVRTPSARRLAKAAGFPLVRQLPRALVARGRRPAPPRPLPGRGLRIGLAADRSRLNSCAAVLAIAACRLAAPDLRLVLPFSDAEAADWRRRWGRLALRLGVDFALDRSLGSAPVGEVDVLVAAGSGQTPHEAALAALAAGVPVVAGPGDAAELIEDGANGVLARRFDEDGLEEALVRLLAFSPGRREELARQGSATAFVHAHADPFAVDFLDACVVAARSQRSRAARREAGPVREVLVSARPGQRFDFLGFRSPDPLGPQLLAADLPPDWSAVEGRDGEVRLVAGGLSPGEARFRVAGECVEIGFGSKRRGADIQLEIDGVRTNLQVRSVVWREIA